MCSLKACIDCFCSKEDPPEEDARTSLLNNRGPNGYQDFPPMQQESELGNYLRLAPVKVAALPHHAAFDRRENQNSDVMDEDNIIRPAPDVFIHNVLEEALRFADSRVSTFESIGEKKSKPSTAGVKMSHQEIPVNELQEIGQETQTIRPKAYRDWPDAPEQWFARRSRHVDAAQAGTASWNEFVTGLKENHSEHEGEYTPDVFHTHKVLDWADLLEGMTVGPYHNLEMKSKYYNLPIFRC